MNVKPRILVLGGEGMLGHKMTQILRLKFPDTTCSIVGSLEEGFYRKVNLFRQGSVLERVNAMDLPMIEKLLRASQWDVVVNCIGIVKQREEAKDSLISITLNSLLPHKLAAIVSEWGGRIIHFSTDCVFDGRRGLYSEDDASNAEDLYGKSKYLGEVIQTKNALTLRTSIIGRELSGSRSLLEWFLAQQGGTVKGFKRHIFSGVTTLYLSELVAFLIDMKPDLWGLYQVAADPISKFELLCRLREAYRINVQIVPDETESCDRSLKGDRFVQATGVETPKWDVLISGLVSDATPYQQWRG